MRLLRLSTTEMQKLVESYKKEVISIKQNALTYCWYMRGGLQYTDAMNMSTSEFEILSQIVSDNLETTKKSGMAFF